MLRIGRWLQQKRFDVSVIDVKDGFLAQNCEGMELYDIRKPDVGMAIKDGILLTPASMVFDLHNLSFLHGRLKVLFWVVNPTNIYPVYPGLGRLLNRNQALRDWVYQFIMPREISRIKCIYNYCIDRHGLVFMDRSCVHFNRRYIKSTNNIEYLQIPLELNLDINISNKNRINNSSRIGWVGRIDFKMKLPVLKIILKDADKYFSQIGCVGEFHVIGDGDGFNDLFAHSKNFRNLNITFHGVISNDRLSDILLENVDVLFAMGTSALEGASLGIPTVLVDVCTTTHIDYRYRWLFESLDYTLGYVIGNNNDIPSESIMSFENLMLDLNERPNVLSNLCRKYVRENHDINVVGQKLLQLINKNRLNIGDLKASGLLGARRFF